MDEGVLRHLKDAAERGRLIPFIGAGFSSAVAGMPSWSGLVLASKHFTATNTAAIGRSPDELQDAHERADSLAAEGRLTDAFGVVQDLLGGRDGSAYATFLEEAFGRPSIQDAQLLDGLAALGAPLLATTNYDSILEDLLLAQSGDGWATWDDSERAIGLLRRGRGVIHLHGRYDHPTSVILSSADYMSIRRSHQSALKHLSSVLFYSGTLLFLATSLDGVTDPHLGEILKEFGRISKADPLRTPRHVILTRGEPSAADRVKYRDLGIEAISYGTDHADLPKFLKELASDRGTTLPVEPVRDLAANFRSARNQTSLVTIAKDFIERHVFAGRVVRVGFVQKEPNEPHLLRSRHLYPEKASDNAFVYPATLAGWSLVTGRIVSYPDDLDTKCNFDWLEKLGRADRVRASFRSLETAQIAPTFQKYLNVRKVIERLNDDRLMICDFFQDWDGDQPRSTYRQFICVPVPMIEKGASEVDRPEIGVFNIDTKESLALLTPAVQAKLSLVMELIDAAWTNLAGQKNDPVSK